MVIKLCIVVWKLYLRWWVLSLCVCFGGWGCVVNDLFVVKEWEKMYFENKYVRFLCDGLVIWMKKIGLELDLYDWGMGVWFCRYSLMICDIVVCIVNIEEGGGLEMLIVSCMLKDLNIGKDMVLFFWMGLFFFFYCFILFCVWNEFRFLYWNILIWGFGVCCKWCLLWRFILKVVGLMINFNFFKS